MSLLAERLGSGRLVVTCELAPPKGIELSDLTQKAEQLRDVVDAFNLTDSASSIMTMSPLAVAHVLADKGIETILQITGRDRNRIAVQSDLLAAHVLGVTNLVCMTGDPPSAGDNPEAKPVFDLDAAALLRTACALASGEDLAGNSLSGGSPDFFAGAVVNPGAADPDKELRRMGEKVEAGARFFQTQAVYDPAGFERFMDKVRPLGVPILAGFIVVKSAGMARRLNEKLPGVSIPDPIIAELDRAEDRRQASVEIAGRVLSEIKEMCAGVHIMAIGWESLVPEILSRAGISGDSGVQDRQRPSMTF